MIKIIGDISPKRGEKAFNTKESSVKTEGGRNVNDHVEMVTGDTAFKVNMNKKQFYQNKGSVNPPAPQVGSLFSPIQATAYENAPRMKMAKNWIS